MSDEPKRDEEETLVGLNIPNWLLKKLQKDKGNLVLNDFLIEIIKEWYGL